MFCLFLVKFNVEYHVTFRFYRPLVPKKYTYISLKFFVTMHAVLRCCFLHPLTFIFSLKSDIFTLSKSEEKLHAKMQKFGEMFLTRHFVIVDEDNEEVAPKDRQSLVIPEKSSSFSIHPERLCADVCCYCFGKFGSLDTPMHLAQMKSDERRKKILNIERHLTKDSCLCDACYRHVDRKVRSFL